MESERKKHSTNLGRTHYNIYHIRVIQEEFNTNLKLQPYTNLVEMLQIVLRLQSSKQDKNVIQR